MFTEKPDAKTKGRNTFRFIVAQKSINRPRACQSCFAELRQPLNNNFLLFTGRSFEVIIENLNYKTAQKFNRLKDEYHHQRLLFLGLVSYKAGAFYPGIETGL